MIKVKVTIEGDGLVESQKDALLSLIEDAIDGDDGEHIDERAGATSREGDSTIVFDMPDVEEITEQENEEGDPEAEGEDED